MGAWGYGNLDNDTVLDWAADLVETEDYENWVHTVKELEERIEQCRGNSGKSPL